MRLRICGGPKISVSPLFFWERSGGERLCVRCSRCFHPSHVTTRLCLELLRDVVASNPGRHVLDVGCGSGILALAALMMGAHRAVGVDIDGRAVKESAANAASNGLAGRSLWVRGSVDGLRGTFDHVVANLRGHLLIQLLGGLVRLTARPSGRLVLSGFHDIEWFDVRRKAQRRGLEAERVVAADQSFYGIPPSGSFTWMAAVLGWREDAP